METREDVTTLRQSRRMGDKEMKRNKGTDRDVNILSHMHYVHTPAACNKTEIGELRPLSRHRLLSIDRALYSTMKRGCSVTVKDPQLRT